MGFVVSADAYGRFMGRFSEQLAVVLADAVGVSPGQRAIDVGCGPGAMTAVLVERLGPDHVAAVDPSPPFVAAARERFPGVDVQEGGAEELRFADDTFDLAVAELVVQFMRDPVQGVREMGRVVRPGGSVAACVWDHGGGTGPLSPFWKVVHQLDSEVTGERGQVGTTEGELGSVFRDAGLGEVTEGALEVSSRFETFAEWWEPYTLGVGPCGAYVDSLDDAGRRRLEAACREALPDAPFTITAKAWFATGRAT